MRHTAQFDNFVHLLKIATTKTKCLVDTHVRKVQTILNFYRILPFKIFLAIAIYCRQQGSYTSNTVQNGKYCSFQCKMMFMYIFSEQQ